MTPERALAPSPAPADVDTRARLARLLDVYGAVLTEHQREACVLHINDDWSYTELAEHFAVTRSAAHDLVRRAIAQLESFESRLGHAEELARRDRVEAELRARLGEAV